MPASPPASRREAAVTEVVGQILIFGILSTVLILSLLAFGVAKEGAEDRVSEVRGESAVQRVASAIVEVALFAESAPGDALEVRSLVDLPESLEGRSYTLDLDANEVKLRTGGGTLTAALFQSGAPQNVVVCNQSPIGGGTVAVVVSTKGTSTQPPDCPEWSGAVSGTRLITLEYA